MKLPLSAPRLGLAIGLVAGASVLVAAAALSSSSSDGGPAPVSQTQSTSPSTAGTGSGPSTTSATTATTATTAPTASTATTAPAPRVPAGGSRVVHAGGGDVTYTVAGGQLSLVSATPNGGWSVEVEQAAGREIEVDFRSGSQRVQVNIELEDGQVRERVRARDDATGSDVRVEDGVVTRHDAGDDHGGDDHGDDSGHGRHGGDDDGDDSGHGGHGGDDDHDEVDDDSGSGSSGSGSSGSG